MARFREDYAQFTSRRVEILAIGPDKPDRFGAYWEKEKLDFPGLSDPDHAVAGRYKQEVILIKQGRMPLVCILDQEGLIRYAHYGKSMADIPQNQTLLEVIDQLIAASE